MDRKLLAVALALAIAGTAACMKAPETPEASAPAPTASAAPAPAPKPASDERLAWLEGKWCGGEDGEVIEETWLAPLKNEMIGMSRTLRGGRMISFEYMRIMDLEGKITFIGQPGGGEPVNFERTDGDVDWIRFENPEHDYPQRIQYRRVGDELHAEIGGPGANNVEEVIPFTYKRCDK